MEVTDKNRLLFFFKYRAILPATAGESTRGFKFQSSLLGPVRLYTWNAFSSVSGNTGEDTLSRVLKHVKLHGSSS